MRKGRSCQRQGPPCVMGPGAGPAPHQKGCMFNLRLDPTESKNIASTQPVLFADLVQRLKDRGATAPPLSSAYPLGEKNKTTTQRSCDRGLATGYLFPDDY